MFVDLSYPSKAAGVGIRQGIKQHSLDDAK